MAAAPVTINLSPDELEACILSRERKMIDNMARLTGSDISTIKDYIQSVNVAVAQALKQYLYEKYPNAPRIEVWLAALRAAMKAGFGTFRCLVKKALEGDETAKKLLYPSPENAAILAEFIVKNVLPIVFKILKGYHNIRYPERVPDEYARLAAEYAKAKNLKARKYRPA